MAKAVKWFFKDCKVAFHQIWIEKKLVSPLKRKYQIFQVLFTISIVLKGIDGVVEFTGGLIFAILTKESIVNIISSFLEYDIFEIPNQTLIRWITDISHALTSNIKIFISIVLIGSGFIKFILSINLLLRKLIAFHIGFAFLITLFIYQIVQMFFTPRPFLFAMNAFDGIVIFLIWRQYVHLKKIHGFH